MNTTLSVPSQVISNSQAEFCKAAVFQVADQWLALPATAILKVIPFSTFTNGAMQDGKLVLWDNCPLVRLELHSLLSQRGSHATSSTEQPLLTQQLTQSKYVLIAWSPTGDRCAILVDELPILLDIPLSKVQQLPPNYRQTISSIARYMVALPYKGAVLTILLLNLQQALYKGLSITAACR